MEDAATPFAQLVLHRSLDVLVGVHGSQLTQAVLLPDHAHILELLPWITDYIRGKWVQTKNGPTPLGVIFHNTNLNHVGFSLDRGSVPLCRGVPEKAELHRSCFLPPSLTSGRHSSADFGSRKLPATARRRITKNGHVPFHPMPECALKKTATNATTTTAIAETTVTDDEHDHFHRRRRSTGAGKAATSPSETSSTSPTREYFAS